MAQDRTHSDDWSYCIEIRSDFKGLAILQEDVAEWMKSRGDPGHRVEVTQPATLVVRFQSYQQAQFFYFSFRGATATFTNLNDNDEPS
jgi:hypothetical protein